MVTTDDAHHGMAARLVDLGTAGHVLRDAVLALNRAVEAMTSPLTAATLDDLIAVAAFAQALVGPDGRCEGFLIGLAPGAAYASPNYRWFCDRLARFAYIDRVVVAGDLRGGGRARGLYAAFAAHAAQHALGPLVCEVNSDPPNPGSDAFHAALGFTEMGQGRPVPGKVVRYLIRTETPTRHG